MRTKSLAILSFLQAMLITLSLVVVNISLYKALIWFNLWKYDGYHETCDYPLPIKMQFYLVVQENSLILYLIPIVWFFIILFFNNRPQSSPFINKISFWSAIFILVLFIFVIVDAAYLQENLFHDLWRYGYNHNECTNLDCLFWRYIEKHFFPS